MWWMTAILVVAGIGLGVVNVFNGHTDGIPEIIYGQTWFGILTLACGAGALVTGAITLLNLEKANTGQKCQQLMLLLGAVALLILPTLLGNHLDVSGLKADNALQLLYPTGSLLAFTGFSFYTEDPNISKKEQPEDLQAAGEGGAFGQAGGGGNLNGEQDAAPPAPNTQ